MKELLLTKSEKDLTITCLEQEKAKFQKELETYTTNKEFVLTNIYADYAEDCKEECILEDIDFFKAMIVTYDELLVKFRSEESLLVNDCELEHLVIIIEPVLETNSDYLTIIRKLQ